MSHWWLLAHMLILHLSWLLISACSNIEVWYSIGLGMPLTCFQSTAAGFCIVEILFSIFLFECSVSWICPAIYVVVFLKHLLIWEQWLCGFLLNTCTVVLIFCEWKVFQWCQNCCIYHYNEFCETLSALCISTWSSFLNVNFLSMKWFCCM